jgi:glucose/arabinose dehydrogenase
MQNTQALRKCMKKIIFLLAFLWPWTVAALDLPINLLKLPSPLKITVYARVANARQMALGAKGTLFVGSLAAGKVYAVLPMMNGSRQVITIASGLNMPNGVAFRGNALYVAENDKILRFDRIEDHLSHPPSPITIAKLPNKTHHGWRYIRFGPDGKLYLGIGAPCNVCLSKDEEFATIIRMNPDGSAREIYARGVRNTVGFDWNPLTHQLWFTDNGRDWLGDNSPPDEINIVTRLGQHFGFPYCHGKNISDPQYGRFHACSEFTSPVWELPAHVAPLGMKFYTGKLLPSEYHNQLFVAEHGSWNRSAKVGYQVILVKVVNNKAIGTVSIVTGWLQGQTAWGRPVDILIMPDGSLLVSDDFANAIYQIKSSS